ncbi:MAG: SH3 domain-containing protein [Gammaproteobacteria bacterium]|nr:SH3 domain-containing protein [Gammaproteobacteria bacterium]
MEIQERQTSLRDYMKMLKRRKLQMLITFVVMMILTLLLSFGLPSKYRSTATVLLEEQEVTEEYDRRQSAVEYADARVYKVQQRALTSINLSAMIDKFKLYQDRIDRVPRSELIEEMRENIHQDLVSADVIDPRSGRPTRVTIAFDLSFDHRNPVTAQKVANELVDLYRSENIEQSMEKVSETADFYRKQVEVANREVLDLEERLARFKAENEGVLPEFVPLIIQLMQKADTTVSELRRQLVALEERRIFLQSTLMQTDPHGGNAMMRANTAMTPNQEVEFVKSQLRTTRATYGPNHPDVRRLEQQLASLTGGMTLGTDLAALDQDIADAEAQLQQARRTYSDQHPEVLQLQRTLTGLQDERAAAASAAGSAANALLVSTNEKVSEKVNVRNGPSTSANIVGTLRKGEYATLVDSSNSQWNEIALTNGATGFVSKGYTDIVESDAPAQGDEEMPTNPAYITLQANLATAVTQIRSLQGQLEDVTAKARGYEQSLDMAPLVEREYSALMRDLTDKRSMLQGLKVQLEQANFSEDVLLGQKGQKFTLIEPPIAAVTPHSPNRLALLFLGLVLSLFGTVAAAVIAESLDSAVRSAFDIVDISGAAPLAAIPVITNREDTAKSRRTWVIAGVGTLAGMAVLLAIVHFAFRPLDILWFTILRQLGL